ncbi:hypothetical protein K4F52_005941 [Lecanicillium sp. MT-2017a]|nr:hypothetical protein K4F52_005941 [Lecanicillium sp. MT-2017a]
MSNTTTTLVPTATRSLDDIIISIFNDIPEYTVEPIPDKIPNCSAVPFDWVLYIATVVILCLGWWLLELPLLFTTPGRQPFSIAGDDVNIYTYGRFRRFSDAIRWNCARTLNPSYVGVLSIARNTDSRAWAGLYYFGGERISATTSPFTWWQWTKVLLIDFVPVAVEALLIARSSKEGMMTNFSLIMPGWWLLPYTVPCFVGWYLLVLRHMRNPPKVGTVILIGGPIVLVGGLTVAVPLFVQLIRAGMTPAILPAIFLSWALVLVPFTLMNCCDGRLHAIFYVWNTVCRIMPLMTAMFDSRPVFPFCSHNTAGVVIGIAVLGGFVVMLLGISGGAGLCEMYRPYLRDFKNRAAAADAAEEAAEKMRALRTDRNDGSQLVDDARTSVDKVRPTAKDRFIP